MAAVSTPHFSLGWVSGGNRLEYSLMLPPTVPNRLHSVSPDLPTTSCGHLEFADLCLPSREDPSTLQQLIAS